jgi:hypothetical protein
MEQRLFQANFMPYIWIFTTWALENLSLSRLKCGAARPDFGPNLPWRFACVPMIGTTGRNFIFWRALPVTHHVTGRSGVASLCLATFAASLISTPSASANTCQSASAEAQHGTASWYGTHYDGRKTASGKTYHMKAMTAAHPTLPLGSFVHVTNTLNHRSVVVRVTDRGPFVGNRILDVSLAAAELLGFRQSGLAPVLIIPKIRCAPAL